MSGSRRAGMVVWLIWAGTVASVLLAIARDGRNIPFEEDWLMVAPMTGHEPDLPAWLWSQNSEHRLPLPRLVNLALLRGTGDLRATMVFDTLVLAALAAGMILVARGLRGGRSSAADGFFPLLLLHLGNWDNLVWAWQIQFVFPTALAGALLLVIVARPGLPTTGLAAAAAVGLVSLPLSGANGLLFAPPLAAWFAWVAWQRRRVEPPQGGGWLLTGAAVLATLLCAVYFLGYQASPWNRASPGPMATLETTGKFLALGLGPAAERSWPLFGAAAAAILLASLAVLLTARSQGDQDRLRIAGLVAFLAAAALLALAVGWGRAGRAAETGRMPSRYVLLAAPGMCAAYFTLLLYGGGRLRRLGPAALAVLLALLFPLNTHAGLKRREWFGAGMSAFERDLAAGIPIATLAQRHHGFLLHWDPALMLAGMRQLGEAGIGPFRSLVPSEPTPAAPDP